MPREVDFLAGGAHAHELALVAAPVVANRGHRVTFRDNDVELVTTVGKRVEERLADSDEARPVEHGCTEDSCFEVVVDGLEPAEVTADELRVGAESQEL